MSNKEKVEKKKDNDMSQYFLTEKDKEKLRGITIGSTKKENLTEADYNRMSFEELMKQ